MCYIYVERERERKGWERYSFWKCSKRERGWLLVSARAKVAEVALFRLSRRLGSRSEVVLDMLRILVTVQPVTLHPVCGPDDARRFVYPNQARLIVLFLSPTSFYVKMWDICITVWGSSISYRGPSTGLSSSMSMTTIPLARLAMLGGGSKRILGRKKWWCERC